VNRWWLFQTNERKIMKAFVFSLAVLLAVSPAFGQLPTTASAIGTTPRPALPPLLLAGVLA
jgi:hypothetical protein